MRMESYALKKDTLYETLRREILAGKYSSETRLPKELDFCRQLGVGKVTLRSALEKLEADGLVARIPGKGTFIRTEHRSNLILVAITRKSGIELSQNYILPGIESAASAMGFRTELCFIEYLRNLSPDKALKILREKKLCSVLLLTSCLLETDPEVVILRELGVPVLIAHGLFQDRLTGFGLMYVNNRQAWMDGLRYLAEKGHRRIGIVSLHPDEIRGWKCRELPGVFRALDLEFDPSLFYCAKFEPEAIRAVAQRILSSNVLPTALFCYSDFYAIEIMNYLQAGGIRIPEDIALMGYCGYPGATLLDPPLSTVDLNYSAIGRIALEILASSESWFHVPEAAVPQVMLPHQIVERESTRIVRNEREFRLQYLNHANGETK